MIPTTLEGVQLLAGSEAVTRQPLPPYAAPTLDFLHALSKELQSDPEAAQLADVMTFAFWIRRANLERLARDFQASGSQEERLGLGLVLHIAPSNVPINFAFSYVFGLLAGNSCIVRVPSKTSAQVTQMHAAMNRVFSSGAHPEILQRTAIVRYARDAQTTATFSAQCRGRVIWGGDASVQAIRAIPAASRAVELTFADRYSLCVLNPQAISALEDTALLRLATDFYNDSYLVDQNACSSPHLLIWHTPDGHAPERDMGKRLFWDAVEQVVRTRYPMEPVKQIDKYTQLLHDAVALDGNVALLARHDEYVYRVALDELPADLETLRGRFGYFYEYDCDDLTRLCHIVTDRYQTISYFGLDKQRLRDLVIANQLRGIDRIVPVGKALDIDVVWDGYDVVRNLSRIIDLR